MGGKLLYKEDEGIGGEVFFTNPTRCTGQGKCLEGILWLVSSKEDIQLFESMRVAYHADIDSHLGYADPDEEACSQQYCAMTSETVTKEEHKDDTQIVCITYMRLFFNLQYLTLITIL